MERRGQAILIYFPVIRLKGLRKTIKSAILKSRIEEGTLDYSQTRHHSSGLFDDSNYTVVPSIVNIEKFSVTCKMF
jgi:hypothetical protein